VLAQQVTRWKRMPGNAGVVAGGLLSRYDDDDGLNRGGNGDGCVSS
jgi:hypothetical protein